jgi:hypothetical protein
MGRVLYMRESHIMLNDHFQEGFTKYMISLENDFIIFLVIVRIEWLRLTIDSHPGPDPAGSGCFPTSAGAVVRRQHIPCDKKQTMTT